MEKGQYSGFFANPNPSMPIEIEVHHVDTPTRYFLVPLLWWEFIIAMFGFPVKRRPYTYRLHFEGIFAPADQIKNPDRRWWQFWKPKMVTDPVYWERMNALVREPQVDDPAHK